MDIALKDAVENDKTFEIKYGGHEDAIGISKLNDITKFRALIEASKDKMLSKDEDEKLILSIPINELTTPETLAKAQALEPTGIGFQLPVMEIRNAPETYRDKGFKAGNEKWKTVKVKDVDTKTTIGIADWSYSPEKYPQSGAKNNEISIQFKLEISNYKEQHIEASATFSRAFYQERLLEIEQSKLEQVSKNKNTVNRD